MFNEPARSWNRLSLVRRIAWRLQAEAEGGLSARAKKRAKQIANDADLRTNPPKAVSLKRSKENRGRYFPAVFDAIFLRIDVTLERYYEMLFELSPKIKTGSAV